MSAAVSSWSPRHLNALSISVSGNRENQTIYYVDIAEQPIKLLANGNCKRFRSNKLKEIYLLGRLTVETLKKRKGRTRLNGLPSPALTSLIRFALLALSEACDPGTFHRKWILKRVYCPHGYGRGQFYNFFKSTEVFDNSCHPGVLILRYVL